MQYPHLFQPIKIRGLELKNRVVLPAMATHFATLDGKVTGRLINYHAARAKGGNGLNILEATSVHTPSATATFVRICEDEYIPGLKQLTEAIHEAGGKACVQLWQGGLAAAWMDPNAEGVVPSDIEFGGLSLKAASVEKIEECVVAFGEAARRAVEAGFDCVEFHGAHNYSPHMFLSAAFNKRTDEYGGSFEKRARYPLECIRAIRANLPADMPLFMRIDAQDDDLVDGLTIEDVIAFCKLAKEAGVDVVDVSRGNIVSAAAKYEVPPIDLPRGFNVDNAAQIRRETGLITIGVGRINDPDQAEAIIAEGKTDMVAMGRAQIADPEFCNKAQAGRVEDIIRCIGCNQGCYERYMSTVYPFISCMRNPEVGHEGEGLLKETDTAKKVAVIGGGLAGLEAAICLQARGHKPVLFEASDKLGGQFLLAGAAPRKSEMAEAAVSRGQQAIKAGVDVRLKTKADAKLLDELKPDVVIAATGAVPITLNVPGVDLPHVYNTVDALTCVPLPEGKAVVIGGGLVGLEVAEALAARKYDVTVVEMLDEIGKDIGAGRKISILENVYGSGIKPLVNAKCVEITKNDVVVEIGGEKKRIPADVVVVAVGSKPVSHQWIDEWAALNGVPSYTVGDAVNARRAIDAIHEAYELAIKL
ncbi:MAG: FAD-dependent oxidoreductase [Anaerolineaceae bacterium]